MKLGNGPITLRGVTVQTAVLVASVAAAWGALRADIKHLGGRQIELMGQIVELRAREETNAISIARLEAQIALVHPP